MRSAPARSRWYAAEPSVQPVGNGIPWEQWDKLAEPYQLTIQDITSLPAGATLNLLIQDRNIGDSVDGLKHFDGVSRRPTEFFKGLTNVFTKSSGLSGTMKWHWGETHPFTFELLNKSQRMWYPLDDSGFHGISGKHWTQMPPTTKVGWRGAAMRWEDLDKLPELYAIPQ